MEYALILVAVIVIFLGTRLVRKQLTLKQDVILRIVSFTVLISLFSYELYTQFTWVKLIVLILFFILFLVDIARKISLLKKESTL